MSRTTTLVLKALLAVGLLAALLFGLTDWRDVVDVFRGARPRWIPVFVATAIALTAVSSYKWGLFVRGEDGRVSGFRLFGLYLVGMFFNNFLPGSVGGDGIRSYLLGRRIDSQGRALAGVFMERFTGFIAMVTLAAAAFWLSPEARGEPLVVTTVALMAVLCLAVIVALWKPALVRLEGLPVSRLRLVRRLADAATRFHGHLVAFRGDRALLAKAMAVSYVFYFLAALNVWVAGRVLGLELDFGQLLVVTPIVMLIASVPLTPNNIGVWEWGFSVFLAAAGATPAQGLSVALAIRAQTLLSSLFGGLVFLAERDATSPSLGESG